MKIILTEEENSSLEIRHRSERDGCIRDRIKAVLLRSEGRTQLDIAQVLRICPETVGEYLASYVQSQKIAPAYKGGFGKLSESHKAELLAHLEEKTYLTAAQVREHVCKTYAVEFTVSGMTHWLRANGFSYKQPKGTPAKAKTGEQEEFLRVYDHLKKHTPEDQSILFGDGVHPTMASKITCGWIRKGSDKLSPTTGSKTRMNLMGVLNLETMDLIQTNHETIDSGAMEIY